MINHGDDTFSIREHKSVVVAIKQINSWQNHNPGHEEEWLYVGIHCCHSCPQIGCSITNDDVAALTDLTKNGHRHHDLYSWYGFCLGTIVFPTKRFSGWAYWNRGKKPNVENTPAKSVSQAYISLERLTKLSNVGIKEGHPFVCAVEEADPLSQSNHIGASLLGVVRAFKENHDTVLKTVLLNECDDIFVDAFQDEFQADQASILEDRHDKSNSSSSQSSSSISICRVVVVAPSH